MGHDTPSLVTVLRTARALGMESHVCRIDDRGIYCRAIGINRLAPPRGCTAASSATTAVWGGLRRAGRYTIILAIFADNGHEKHLATRSVIEAERGPVPRTQRMSARMRRRTRYEMSVRRKLATET